MFTVCCVLQRPDLVMVIFHGVKQLEEPLV